MTDKSTKTIGEQLVQKREPYWEYMGRRLREERPNIVTESEMYRREIKDMNKQLYAVMIKVAELREEIEDLKYKVKILGGDPRQMEFKF